MYMSHEGNLLCLLNTYRQYVICFWFITCLSNTDTLLSKVIGRKDKVKQGVKNSNFVFASQIKQNSLQLFLKSLWVWILSHLAEIHWEMLSLRKTSSAKVWYLSKWIKISWSASWTKDQQCGSVFDPLPVVPLGICLCTCNPGREMAC